MTTLRALTPSTKETTVPFQVGDKVFDGGNGIVYEIVPKPTEYKVQVIFTHARKVEYSFYTCDGRRQVSDEFRSLFHGHDLPITTLEKLPEGRIILKHSRSTKLRRIPVTLQVGDKVFDGENGVVIEINPIKVEFKNSPEVGYSYYNKDGFRSSNVQCRSLFHGHDLNLASLEKLPIRSVEKDGNK